MASRCGEQYRRRYILKEIKPPGFAAHIGISTHKVREKELKYKVNNNGNLLTLEEVKDSARDALIHGLEKNGLIMLPEEWAKGKKKCKAEAIDISVKLSEKHHEVFSPIINPVSCKHVEKFFKLEIKGFDYDLIGYIDVEESDGIRDLKTSGKKISQADIDTDTQMSMYSLDYFSRKKKFPEITIDTLLKYKKGIEKDIKTTTRNLQHFQDLLERIKTFSIMLEKGVFMPTNTGNWWCSANWCGYWNTCKYVGYWNTCKYVRGFKQFRINN
jgi:hypothetical protein